MSIPQPTRPLVIRLGKSGRSACRNLAILFGVFIAGVVAAAVFDPGGDDLTSFYIAGGVLGVLFLLFVAGAIWGPDHRLTVDGNGLCADRLKGGASWYVGWGELRAVASSATVRSIDQPGQAQIDVAVSWLEFVPAHPPAFAAAHPELGKYLRRTGHGDTYRMPIGTWSKPGEELDEALRTFAPRLRG